MVDTDASNLPEHNMSINDRTPTRAKQPMLVLYPQFTFVAFIFYIMTTSFIKWRQQKWAECETNQPFTGNVVCFWTLAETGIEC